jgi:uncharacterized membrane protein (DUF373 family)
MSRKLVILDSSATPAATITALAAVTLVLGAVYWLPKDQGAPRITCLQESDLTT